MAMLSHPSFGPRTALTYVTIGALLDVWTGVWFFAFRPSGDLSPTATFWVWGLFLTGLALIVIGLLLGPLGRFARKAELPPRRESNKRPRTSPRPLPRRKPLSGNRPRSPT
jgi:hypothetical protein